MELTALDLTRSPDDSGSRRVLAKLRMEKDRRELTIWFDIPEAYQGAISQTGNPWLVLAVPIAMNAGEDISIDLPVDSLLSENIRGLMAVWHDWFPHLRPAKIRSSLVPSHGSLGNRRGMFFSGGLDSFFTLLRHDTRAIGCGSGPVDALIFVEGFDIPLSSKTFILSARENLTLAAHKFDKTLLPISSNLRELDSPYRSDWLLSHACAMAAIGHLLNPEFSEILIASSYEYGHLFPIGSHPMTDPLLSSRSLRMIHDGATYARDEKLQSVCASGRALQSLRVCYTTQRHDNCSSCPKCLFTMSMIDALGAADKATTFDWRAYKMESIASLLLDDFQIFRANRIIEMARRTGRDDLVSALQRAIDKSDRIRRTVDVVRGMPFLWRFENATRQFLINMSARN